MTVDYIVRFGMEYGEGHTAYAERLAVTVSNLTASEKTDEEQIRALAYLAVKGPAEMTTTYWYREDPPHPTGERQTDGMIKKFLSRLGHEEREKFREFAERFAPTRVDRIQYLLGEN